MKVSEARTSMNIGTVRNVRAVGQYRPNKVVANIYSENTMIDMTMFIILSCLSMLVLYCNYTRIYDCFHFSREIHLFRYIEHNR